MDVQDIQDKGMKYSNITKVIIGCAFDVINYLNATGVEVGLLINFGKPKLEYMRFTRSKKSC